MSVHHELGGHFPRLGHELNLDCGIVSTTRMDAFQVKFSTFVEFSPAWLEEQFSIAETISPPGFHQALGTVTPAQARRILMSFEGAIFDTSDRSHCVSFSGSRKLISGANFLNYIARSGKPVEVNFFLHSDGDEFIDHLRESYEAAIAAIDADRVVKHTLPQARKIRRRPGQLATLTPPARDDTRLHVLVCGTNPIPDVYLVPPGDEPLRQHGSQRAGAEIAADTAVMQSAVHAITITSRDLEHASRAPVDQAELRVSADMDVVVLCPSGPDWPKQWQSVEISNGKIGEPYRPPANFAIGCDGQSGGDESRAIPVRNLGPPGLEIWMAPMMRVNATVGVPQKKVA